MRLTEEQITEIAHECNFDVTGRLLKFANLVIDAQAAPVTLYEAMRGNRPQDVVKPVDPKPDGWIYKDRFNFLYVQSTPLWPTARPFRYLDKGKA